MTWDPVNLADLQQALDRKKLNANELITMKTLRDAGVASKKVDFGVKLLAKVWPLTYNLRLYLLACTADCDNCRLPGTIHLESILRLASCVEARILCGVSMWLTSCPVIRESVLSADPVFHACLNIFNTA